MGAASYGTAGIFAGSQGTQLWRPPQLAASFSFLTGGVSRSGDSALSASIQSTAPALGLRLHDDRTKDRQNELIPSSILAVGQRRTFAAVAILLRADEIIR
jgi:hypothetical protein